jgi:hypothetical protein
MTRAIPSRRKNTMGGPPGVRTRKTRIDDPGATVAVAGRWTPRWHSLKLGHCCGAPTEE